MANETTENELNQTGEPGTEYFMETLPGQDRYVAPLDETPVSYTHLTLPTICSV